MSHEQVLVVFYIISGDHRHTHTHTFGVLDCLYLFVEDVLKPPVFSKKTFDACLKVHLLLVYPLVMTNSGSYEKLLFIGDLPIKHGDFP